jgi:transcriptional regulator with XRE-family HTH domain
MTVFPCINIIATGANIKNIRIANGLSVRDLQDYFGFEQPQAIYKWQWGECLPSIDNLYALSKLFSVPIDKILVGNNEDFNITHKYFTLSRIILAFSR